MIDRWVNHVRNWENMGKMKERKKKQNENEKQN
jgi:hypothetical protein